MSMFDVPSPELRDMFRVGDVVEIHGIFRDGTMDEARQAETENVQKWRVEASGAALLTPVLDNGDPDTESYWFGRSTRIALEGGCYGVVSTPGTVTVGCGIAALSSSTK